MKAKVRTRLRALCMLTLLQSACASWAEEPPEYRMKVAYLYNFALFTEWPSVTGDTLNLCVYGYDPFGKELDRLQGRKVGERSIAVRRNVSREALFNCQIVFISSSGAGDLPRVLNELQDKPVLTVAEIPDAGRNGVMLNMAVAQNKITFEANLQAARAVRLNFSSKLLRLATEVIQ